MFSTLWHHSSKLWLLTALLTTSTQATPLPYRGADISMLSEVERHGGKLLEQGKEVDAFALLKAHHVNLIRLRLWVDPKSSEGAPYGGGNSDLTTTLALAKRAKAAGMSLLLDLHYSDFWTDPKHQTKPKAWQALSFPALTDQVERYTKETLQHFVKAGLTPDLVQVGNELNSGMLWPEGKSWGQGGGEFDRLATLLKAGIRGVKSATAGEKTSPRIVLHLAEGGKSETFRWWFDEIIARQVSFDIIGLSYYPFWDAPLPALATNLQQLASRYHKPLLIVETAYAHDLQDCDNTPNTFGPAQEQQGGYPASPQGQLAFLKALQQQVAAVPDGLGLGIIYWEPFWLPVKGATWATKAGMTYNNDHWQEGNGWENLALVSCKGETLPALSLFAPESK